MSLCAEAKGKQRGIHHATLRVRIRQAAKTVKIKAANKSPWALASPDFARYVPDALQQRDQIIRRGGRVVERTALEMRHTCKGIVGSNPTLSTILNLGV